MQYKHFDTRYVKIGLFNAKLLANLFRLSETYQLFRRNGRGQKTPWGYPGTQHVSC